jgi:hypothetical protein
MARSIGNPKAENDDRVVFSLFLLAKTGEAHGHEFWEKKFKGIRLSWPGAFGPKRLGLLLVGPRGAFRGKNHYLVSIRLIVEKAKPGPPRLFYFNIKGKSS